MAWTGGRVTRHEALELDDAPNRPKLPERDRLRLNRIDRGVA